MRVTDSLHLKAYENHNEWVEAVKRDGYVYLPGILDSEEIRNLRASMDALEAAPEQFDRHQTPQNGAFLNKCINNTFNRDRMYLDLIDRSPVVEIEQSLHGADCHIIGMTAWLTGPGRPDQALHVDWQPLELPPEVMADERVEIPVYITTAHFYLDDVTEDLGPTQFVPGSHKAGHPPRGDVEWQGIPPRSILCAAGDVVVFRSEVWHRGTANNSTETRYLLQIHYANRMITQKFPPYLNKFQFANDIIRAATPRQRLLLGDHTQSNYD